MQCLQTLDQQRVTDDSAYPCFYTLRRFGNIARDRNTRRSIGRAVNERVRAGEIRCNRQATFKLPESRDRNTIFETVTTGNRIEGLHRASPQLFIHGVGRHFRK